MEAGNIGIWALPVLHNAGMLFSIVRAVIYPATTVLMPRWDVARYFDMIEREKVQFAFTIGPHAPAIASYPHVAKHDLSSLKMLFTLMGAESIERATGVCSTNMFGITEGLILTGTPGASAEIRHGSIGMRCSPTMKYVFFSPVALMNCRWVKWANFAFAGLRRYRVITPRPTSTP